MWVTRWYEAYDLSKIATNGISLRLRLCAVSIGWLLSASPSFIFDRCYLAPKGRLIEIELPEIKTVADLVAAHGAIMAAICTGQITPDEGATLADILESRRRAIETTELEERIATLEAQKGNNR
jgi:hypothetical protein